MSNHMSKWPKNIRETGLVERVCPHGIGHPDPDWLKGRPSHWGVHGCDGCCSTPSPNGPAQRGRLCKLDTHVREHGRACQGWRASRSCAARFRADADLLLLPTPRKRARINMAQIGSATINSLTLINYRQLRLCLIPNQLRLVSPLGCRMTVITRRKRRRTLLPTLRRTNWLTRRTNGMGAICAGSSWTLITSLRDRVVEQGKRIGQLEDDVHRRSKSYNELAEVADELRAQLAERDERLRVASDRRAETAFYEGKRLGAKGASAPNSRRGK